MLNRGEKITTAVYAGVIMLAATTIIAFNINNGWQISADTANTNQETIAPAPVSNEIAVVPKIWQLITIPRNFTTSPNVKITDILTCKNSSKADYEALYFKGANLMETIANLQLDLTDLSDPEQFGGIISQFETSATIDTASGTLARGHGYLIQPKEGCNTLTIASSLTVPADDLLTVALPSDKNTNLIGNPYPVPIGKYQVNVIVNGTRKSLKTAYEDGSIKRIIFYHAVDNQLAVVEHYAHNGLEFLPNKAFLVEMAQSGQGVQFEFVKKGDESCNLEPELIQLQLNGDESKTLQIGYCEPDDLPLRYSVVGPDIVTGQWVEGSNGQLKLTGNKIPTALTTTVHIESNDTGRKVDISTVVVATEGATADPKCTDSTQAITAVPGGWNLMSLPFEPADGMDLNKLMPSSTLYTFAGYGKDYAPGGKVRRGDGFWLRSGVKLICVDKTKIAASTGTASMLSVEYTPDAVNAQELYLAGNPFDAEIPWTNVKIDVEGFGPKSLSDAFKAKAVIGVFLWDPVNFSINNDYITFVDKATTTSGNASSLTDYTALEGLKLHAAEGFWIMTANGKKAKLIYQQ